MNSSFPYIHGYSTSEQSRLRQQAQLMEPYVFDGLPLEDGLSIVEVGCGVGAQTEILLRRFPGSKVTGVDISSRQISTADEYFRTLEIAGDRVDFHQMDGSRLAFADETFDVAFIAWTLEHVADPGAVLEEVRRVLRPGGLLVVTEVMNFTFHLHPPSPAIATYWGAFNQYQVWSSGDPAIGVRLGSILHGHGFTAVETIPRNLHFDARFPARRREFLADWRLLLLTSAASLVEAGAVTGDLVEQVMADFDHAASDPSAVFYFTFMRALARRPD